jgi:hypothetical protein
LAYVLMEQASNSIAVSAVAPTRSPSGPPAPSGSHDPQTQPSASRRWSGSTAPLPAVYRRAQT